MLSKILTSQIILTDWIKMIPNVVKDFDVSDQDQDDEETFYRIKLFSQNSLPSSDSAIQQTIFNFWKLKTAELKNGTLAKPK